MKTIRALVAASLAVVMALEPIAASGFGGAGFAAGRHHNPAIFEDQAVVSFLTFFTHIPMFRRAQYLPIRRMLPQIDWWGATVRLPGLRHAGEVDHSDGSRERFIPLWPAKISWQSAPMRMDDSGTGASAQPASVDIGRKIQDFHDIARPRLELDFDDGYGQTRFTLDVVEALQRIRANYLDDAKFSKHLGIVSSLVERILAAPENPVLSISYLLDAWLAASLDGFAPGLPDDEPPPILSVAAGTDASQRPLQVYLDSLKSEDSDEISRWATKADREALELIGLPATLFKGFKLVSIGQDGRPVIEGYVLYFPTGAFAYQMTLIEIVPVNRTQEKLKGVGTVLMARLAYESVRNGIGGRLYAEYESGEGLSMGRRQSQKLFAGVLRRSVAPHNPPEWAHAFHATTIESVRDLLAEQRRYSEKIAESPAATLRVYDRTLGEELPALSLAGLNPVPVEPAEIQAEKGDEVENKRTGEKGIVAEIRIDGSRRSLRLEEWPNKNSWETATRFRVTKRAQNLGAIGAWTWIGMKSVVWMGFWEAVVTTAGSGWAVAHRAASTIPIPGQTLQNVIHLSLAAWPVVIASTVVLLFLHYYTGVAQADPNAAPVTRRFWMSVRATAIAASSFLAIPFIALGLLLSPWWLALAIVMGIGLHPFTNAVETSRDRWIPHFEWWGATVRLPGLRHAGDVGHLNGFRERFVPLWPAKISWPGAPIRMDDSEATLGDRPAPEGYWERVRHLTREETHRDIQHTRIAVTLHSVTAGRAYGALGDKPAEQAALAEEALRQGVIAGLDNMEAVQMVRAKPDYDRSPVVFKLEGRLDLAEQAAAAGANVLDGMGWTAERLRVLRDKFPDVLVVAEIADDSPSVQQDYENAIACRADGLLLRKYGAWNAKYPEGHPLSLASIRAANPGMLIIVAGGIFENVAGPVLSRPENLVVSVGTNQTSLPGFRTQVQGYIHIGSEVDPGIGEPLNSNLSDSEVPSMVEAIQKRPAKDAVHRFTASSILILLLLTEGPSFGNEIIKKTGLNSGTIFPILHRFEEWGYVHSVWEWEPDDAERTSHEGRPPRRIVRLTSMGKRDLDAILAIRGVAGSNFEQFRKIGQKQVPSGLNFSHPALMVLLAVEEGHRYGSAIMQKTGFASGTVFAILRRLLEKGLVRAEWEWTSRQRSRREGRRPRHFYEVTPGARMYLDSIADATRELTKGPESPGAIGAWTWIGMKSVVWMGFWEAVATTAGSGWAVAHRAASTIPIPGQTLQNVIHLSLAAWPVVIASTVVLLFLHYYTGVAQADRDAAPVTRRFWLSARATAIALSSFLAVPFIALGLLASPLWLVGAAIFGIGLHPALNSLAVRRLFTRGLSVRQIKLKRQVNGVVREARGEVWTVDLKRVQADLDWAENYRIRDLEQEFHVDNDPNVGHTVEQYVQRDESPEDVILATNGPQEWWVQNNTILIHEGRYILPPAGRIDLHQAFARRRAREAGTEIPDFVPPQGKYHILSLDPDKPGIFEVELDAQGIPTGEPPVREGFAGPLLKRDGVLTLDGRSGIHFNTRPHKLAGGDVEWGPEKRQAYSLFGYDDRGRLVIVQLHGTTEDPELSDPSFDEVLNLPAVRRLRHVMVGGTSADVQRYSPLAAKRILWTGARASSLLEMAVGSPRGRRIPMGLRFFRRRSMAPALKLRPQPATLLLRRLDNLAVRISLPASVLEMLRADIVALANELTDPSRVRDHRAFGRLLIRLAILGLIDLPEGDLQFKVPSWGNLPVDDQEHLFVVLVEMHRAATTPRAVSLVSAISLGAPMQLSFTPLKVIGPQRRLAKEETQRYAESNRLEGGLHTVTAGKGLAGKTRRELVKFAEILLEHRIMPGVDRLDVLTDLRSNPRFDHAPIIFLLDQRTHQALAAAAAGANILTGSTWTPEQIHQVHAAYPDVWILSDVSASSDNAAAIRTQAAKGMNGIVGKPYKDWSDAMTAAEAAHKDLLLIEAQGLFEPVAADELARHNRVVAAVGFNAKTPAEFRAQASRYDAARTAAFLRGGFPLQGSFIPPAALSESDPETFARLKAAWEVLRDYLVVRDELPKKAGALFVFGSHLKMLPLAAARLARRLPITRIIFSGGVGRLTPVEWRRTSEGEVYTEVARRLGLWAQAEGKSKTTWQNALFSLNQLERDGISVEDVVVMQMPFGMRRAMGDVRQQLIGKYGERGRAIRLYGWAPFIPSFEDVLPGWSRAEWEWYLLVDACMELPRYINYQKMKYIPTDAVPREVVEAGIVLGEFFNRDQIKKVLPEELYDTTKENNAAGALQTLRNELPTAPEGWQRRTPKSDSPSPRWDRQMRAWGPDRWRQFIARSIFWSYALRSRLERGEREILHRWSRLGAEMRPAAYAEIRALARSLGGPAHEDAFLLRRIREALARSGSPPQSAAENLSIEQKLDRLDNKDSAAAMVLRERYALTDPRDVDALRYLDQDLEWFLSRNPIGTAYYQPHDAPLVSVVVLHYGESPEATMRLLENLSHQTYDAFNVILVDNNSPDGFSRQFSRLQKLMPARIQQRITLVTNALNLGYTGGNNQAARKALSLGSDYVLFVNNDAILEKRALERMMDSVKNHPAVGSAAPFLWLYDAAQEPVANHLAHSGDLLESLQPMIQARRDGFMERLRRESEGLSTPLIQEVENADFYFKEPTLLGTVHLVRSDMLRLSGGFDTRLFMYADEADLGYRQHTTGLRKAYVPGALAAHRVFEDVNSPRSQYFVWRNTVLNAQMFYSRNEFGRYLIRVGTPYNFIADEERAWGTFQQRLSGSSVRARDIMFIAVFKGIADGIFGRSSPTHEPGPHVSPSFETVLLDRYAGKILAMGSPYELLCYLFDEEDPVQSRLMMFALQQVRERIVMAEAAVMGWEALEQNLRKAVHLWREWVMTDERDAGKLREIREKFRSETRRLLDAA